MSLRVKWMRWRLTSRISQQRMSWFSQQSRRQMPKRKPEKSPSSKSRKKVTSISKNSPTSRKRQGQSKVKSLSSMVWTVEWSSSGMRCWTNTEGSKTRRRSWVRSSRFSSDSSSKRVLKTEPYRAKLPLSRLWLRMKKRKLKRCSNTRRSCLRRSLSSRPSEKRWLEQLPKLRPRQGRPVKNSRSRNFWSSI